MNIKKTTLRNRSYIVKLSLKHNPEKYCNNRYNFDSANFFYSF